ncbi:peptidase domain-containing ABC transporter [Bacillus swezeyi]|uniref:peptidase domain-containing ABC transporter n=1 Tax=Bacillus swezeyi TaxID=1925020 RepID=UPI0039C70596
MRNKRLKFIEQMEHSECGLACITMILNYYRKNIELGEVRDRYGVPKGGNTLQQLQHILSDYGIKTKGIRVKDLDVLRNFNTPCICLWENKHFIVLEKISKKNAYVADPATGKKKIELANFIKGFSKVILLPTEVLKTEVEAKKKHENVLFKIVFSQKKFIFFTLICTVFIQVFGLFIPILTQTLIDNNDYLRFNNNFAFQTFILLGILFLSYYCFQVIRSLLIANFQKNFDIHLMTKFISKLISLPMNFFVNRSTGDLIFRSNLSVYIRQILTQRVTSLIIDSIFIFVYLFLIFQYSIFLSFIIILTTGVIVFTAILNAIVIKKITDKELLEQSRVQKIVTELIENMETIKISGAGEYFYQEWFKHFQKQVIYEKDKGRISAFLGNLSTSLQFILNLLLVCIGIMEIQKGTLTIGQLIGITAVTPSFMNPVVSIAGFYTEFLVLKSYFYKIQEVINSKSEKNLEVKTNIDKIYELELKNVGFKYSEFEELTLNRINLKVFNNEKVAIVGRSGSGKSTLIKLLSGLYYPSYGEFLVNGKNFTTLNPKDYRKKIGIVNQHPSIFNNTIKDNIVLNNFETEDMNFLFEVVFDSGVDEIIQHLPLGLNTEVSENGSNLSGGQKQRIALARALFKKPSFILMDEPTSALDNISEKKIMDNILKSNLGCIVAAHRLHTIKEFDRIIVIEKGEIVEEGNHYFLMKQKGYYYNLYKNNQR